MKRNALQLAVIGALSMTSASVFAAFVTLPSAGSPVAAGFNYSGSPAGTTAYVQCNTTGDLGSTPTTPPSSSSDACAVFPANETTAPETGFTLVTAANRPITVNNTYTGGVNKTVGNIQEYVWRNTAKTECIYGMKAVMTASASADYLPASGTQYFEINDIARGGFSGRPVAVAYYVPSLTAEVLFRAGLTFTSVQHRTPPEFAELPLTTPAHSSPQPSIVGVDAFPLSTVPTAAQQSAAIDGNWVNFTTDVNIQDDDGSSKAHSSVLYVKTTCDSSAPVAVPEAIRVRQSFQETNGDGVSANRFIEVAIPGFVPPGGSVAPAHTNPF
ncbi:hypothetical protein SAMN05192560_1364 [Methylobacillus rhizosphaerae]|uniref:Uncharacterized protein n=1 Tax=Methylobacillus rhizosphaerae TaxID=551994 RepID=A0A238ZM76_9PROT|nr:hypothetical protein [Methylobacillus rhizosphaerae]SNR84430.1 hypothetical protein SAMN05192560_1364 [Methylobacillus rhizosphaerae]